MSRGLGAGAGRRRGSSQARRPRRALRQTHLELREHPGRPLLPTLGRLSGKCLRGALRPVELHMADPVPRASGALLHCWAVCWAQHCTLPLLLLLLHRT